MRVLLTADTVGGVWTYAIELARALGDYGVEVVLATMGAMPTAEQRVQLQDIPNVELHASDFKLEWMDDPWPDVDRAGYWLLRLEENLQPDVIHLNGYSHGVLPWSAPMLCVGHSCVLSWWQAVKGERAPENWALYKEMVARGLRAADLVLAPTKAMLRALTEHYGPFAASGVVANGRDMGLFRPESKEPFIFTAGRVWDEAKNIAALSEVAPRLQWPVYVAGEEEHPDGGSARHGNVRLLGRLVPQAIPDWYARAAIYALPARYEPFGLSALEAGLCGCALVLGDIPSLREIWQDAALFVPPDEPGAIEAVLNALIADEPHRTYLALAARDRALQFTPRRMAEGYLKSYKYLLGEREPAHDQRRASAIHTRRSQA